MRPLILVFAKAPVAGRVKTRLLGVLDPVQAAELHACLVRDTLETVLEVRDLAGVAIHTDEVTSAWREYPVEHGVQCEGDLGARMYHVLEEGLAAGHPRVMIVGSDTPELQAEDLHELLSLDADVTLGPTEDGGYYAIACRRTHARMFDGVRWSSEHALADSMRASEACGLTTAMGAHRWDVDRAEDLIRLADLHAARRHAAAFCRQLRRDAII